MNSMNERGILSITQDTRHQRNTPRSPLITPLIAAALVLLIFSIHLLAQQSTASQPAPAETPSQAKKLTYEDYVTFAEQAIRSLSAQVNSLQAQNAALRAQVQAEQLGKDFNAVEKSLLQKHGCVSIGINGEMNCDKAEDAKPVPAPVTTTPAK